MLIVAFGGSEGGNIFAKEETKDLRTKFLRLGFSFWLRVILTHIPNKLEELLSQQLGEICFLIYLFFIFKLANY